MPLSTRIPGALRPNPEVGNPRGDVELRRLERAAAAGDPEARWALLRVQHQRGLLPRTPYPLDMIVAASVPTFRGWPPGRPPSRWVGVIAPGGWRGEIANEGISASDEWEFASRTRQVLETMASRGFRWPYSVMTDWFDVDLVWAVHDDGSLNLARYLDTMAEAWRALLVRAAE